MKTENIEKLIDKLNSGNFKDIFLYNISKDVAYGKVWYARDNLYSNENDYDYDTFYFIKDENEEYSAAILVHKNINDLHWFVKESKRKKGILTKALKSVILPHLLSEKPEQYITIQTDDDDEDSFEASRRVALNVGFKEISEAKLLITSENIQMKEINLVRSGMSEDELKILLKKLRNVSIQLKKIDDEFEFKIGVVENFRKLSNKLAYFINDDLEDEYWRLKNKL